MNFKDYYDQHKIILARLYEIAQLFHKHDQEYYPDLKLYQIGFMFNNIGYFYVYNLIYQEVHCSIDIIWLSLDNQEIVKIITNKKNQRNFDRQIDLYSPYELEDID